jgi:inorganic triphosphatase YgiF
MLKQQPIETELKLAISPEGERRLEEHPVFRRRASEPRSERIVTTYFDMPDQDLARRGLSLRVRRAGKKRIQTVKASGKDGALKARGEWEWPLAQEVPDLHLASGTPVAEALASGIDGRLETVAITDVVRTSRVVEHEGATIGAAFDDGAIEAGGASESLHELELELRKGPSGALYRLALALHTATPLSIEVDSKAARGYRLKDRAPAQAERPKSTTLDRKVKAAQGLRDIVGDALGHLLANRAPALAGDMEGIHQVRVAIRRLRSALRLFDPRLEPHTLSLFQDELKRLGRVIGEARDWDVFCDEMVPASFGGAENA